MKLMEAPYLAALVLYSEPLIEGGTRDVAGIVTKVNEDGTVAVTYFAPNDVPQTNDQVPYASSQRVSEAWRWPGDQLPVFVPPTE